MKIIPFENKYRNQVIALILYIQNFEGRVDLSLEEQPDMTDIEGYYQQKGGQFWIAVNADNDVVGTLGLMKIGSDTAVLKKFFVNANYRGKELGISEGLYDRFIEFCNSNAFTKIILDTPSACVRAHSFYKKKGFVRIEKSELPVEYHYPDRDSLLFLKELL